MPRLVALVAGEGQEAGQQLVLGDLAVEHALAVKAVEEAHDKLALVRRRVLLAREILPLPDVDRREEPFTTAAAAAAFAAASAATVAASGATARRATRYASPWRSFSAAPVDGAITRTRVGASASATHVTLQLHPSEREVAPPPPLQREHHRHVARLRAAGGDGGGASASSPPALAALASGLRRPGASGAAIWRRMGRRRRGERGQAVAVWIVWRAHAAGRWSRMTELKHALIYAWWSQS